MNEAFDSVDCTLMSRALAIAIGRTEATGAASARAGSVLTRAIMEATQHGVRDPAALAEYALLHYRQPRGAVVYPARLFEQRRRLRNSSPTSGERIAL